MQTLICPDVHVPFHDTGAIEDWIKRHKPPRIVLLGDALDLHAVTEHRKDKRWADRLDVEIRGGQRWLRNLRTIAPKADITYLAGNHEDRWSRYMDSKAPSLRNLKDLTLPEVLGLPDLGIEWHDVSVKRKGVRVASGQGAVLYCFHGHELRSKYKGSTVLGYCAAYGVNAVIGHTHRYNLDHAAVGGKVHFGIEAGYLGRPTAPAFTYAGPAPRAWRRGWLVADAEQTFSPYPKWISA